MEDLFTDANDKDGLLNLNDSKNFDITAYLKDDPPHSPAEKFSRKHRAGVKKIDMKAQRYILDEDDDVDVETVSECGDPTPILEAGDLNSLLEQFEASEIPDLTLPEDFLETRSPILLKTDVPNIEQINRTQDNLLEESRIECKPVVKIKEEFMENPESVIQQENFYDVIASNMVKTEHDLSDMNVNSSLSVEKQINVKVKIENITQG